MSKPTQATLISSTPFKHLSPTGEEVKTSVSLLHVDQREVFVHWTPLFDLSMHRISKLGNGNFEVKCNHVVFDESVIEAQIKKMIQDEKDE